MILTKTPLRITFGGGGTDIFQFSDLYGGYCLGLAINKYCYVTLNKNIYDKFTILKYSKTEKVSNKSKIVHPIFNKVLNSFEYDHGLEISTFMDVPTSTGLGSSSSFTVGLYNALSDAYFNLNTKKKIAEKAIHLERNILGEKGGIQDQYLCSYGGLNEIHISRNRNIRIKKIDVSKVILQKLLNHLSLFYTGKSRSSSKVQSKVFKNSLELKTTNLLKRIKDIAYCSKNSLINGNILEFGEILKENWNIKRYLLKNNNPEAIDLIYDYAMKNGAIGGRLIGAGGGGFFLFCSSSLDQRKNLINKMQTKGFKNLEFGIDYQGTKKFIL